MQKIVEAGQYLPCRDVYMRVRSSPDNRRNAGRPDRSRWATSGHDGIAKLEVTAKYEGGG
jgi:hypothetical protein